MDLLRDLCVNNNAPFEICSDGPWGVLCPYCQIAETLDKERALSDQLAQALWACRPTIGSSAVKMKMQALAEYDKNRLQA